MSSLKSCLAVFSVVLLCSSVWHADLEAVGWMFEHEHHTADHHHGSESNGTDAHDHSVPLTGDDHDPIWMRSVVEGGAVAVALISVDSSLSDWMGLWLVLSLPARFCAGGLVPRPSLRGLEKRWRFLWRCVADATAPPALN